MTCDKLLHTTIWGWYYQTRCLEHSEKMVNSEITPTSEFIFRSQSLSYPRVSQYFMKPVGSLSC
jgi:hypothetical protein